MVFLLRKGVGIQMQGTINLEKPYFEIRRIPKYKGFTPGSAILRCINTSLLRGRYQCKTAPIPRKCGVVALLPRANTPRVPFQMNYLKRS